MYIEGKTEFQRARMGRGLGEAFCELVTSTWKDYSGRSLGVTLSISSAPSTLTFPGVEEDGVP